MKNFLSRRWVEPILLLLFAIAAYGLFIPKLGLFGDDWPHLWVHHMFGLDGLNRLVAWDRPFSAWVYGLIAPLAGENIWGYHLYLLILRWICSLIFYFLIDKVFPESQPVPFWAAAFFLLYPGFRQQPQPLEFILHFTALAFMLASFWCMVLAVKNPAKAWRYHAIGFITALPIFSVEYFIGLELIRPVLLWLTLSLKENNWKLIIKRLVFNWLPYIAILAFYAYWRVFVFKFPTYKPTFLNQLGTDPVNSITGLGQVLVEEIRAAVLGAWRQIISLPHQSNPKLTYLILIMVILIMTTAILYYRSKQARNVSPGKPLLVGFVAILLAGIPFWITGIPVQLEFPWDRSTLPFMFGGSLLLAGGILLLRPGLRNVTASLLIALCIGMHFQNTVLYQIEWKKLGDFFWQLTWRAPSLKPGTIVLSDEIPLFYYSDNNLTPVLNWTYAPKQNSTDIPYNFFDLGERLGRNLPELKPGLSVEHGYRFVNFKSDSSSLLPVFYKPGGCLVIVNEQVSQDRSIPGRLREAAEFSKPNLLILDGDQSSPPAFIPEPEHGWCYYYQKASLAVQLEKWENVKALYANVLAKDLNPENKSEWVPFIEGLARAGDVNIALELTRKSLEQEEAKPIICGLWNRLSNTESFTDLKLAADQSGCD